MKCAQAQSLLVFYLEKEVTPGERGIIQQHLAGCPACQAELAALSATRQAASQALQSLGACAEPSAQAWQNFQARLEKEALPAPAQSTGWAAAPAPAASRPRYPNPQGVSSMSKRFFAPALAAALVLALAAAFWVRTSTPVSAQQILDRAQQAQANASQALGIHHMKVEMVSTSLEAPGAQTFTTIAESYLDRQSEKMRSVITSSPSGQIQEIFAYDGTYTFSRNQSEDPQPGKPVTIYRTAQKISKEGRQEVDYQEMFESIRNNLEVKLVGTETWPDGRTVYVLRSPVPAKLISKGDVKLADGFTTIVFDAKTYHLLEERTTTQIDGQEVLLRMNRYLVDEVLPAGSPVAWDLSDVAGVQVVDDPQGEHGDLLPEVITRQQLAARTQAAYVLKVVPAGFSEEITSPPRQDEGAPFYYAASYRNSQDNHFVLVTGNGPTNLADLTEETYQTASGWKLTFMKEPENAPAGQLFTSAAAQAPDGTQFMIESSLPREQVKALAETLILLK